MSFGFGGTIYGFLFSAACEKTIYKRETLLLSAVSLHLRLGNLKTFLLLGKHST